MNIEKILENNFKDFLKENYNLEIENISFSKPPKKELWDFAFGAFLLAKGIKKNPVTIAKELKEKLEKDISKYDIIKSIDNDGPFLNIKIDNTYFTKVFKDIYDKKEKYGTKEKNNKTVIIDYIWANVWKPLHIGHMCTPNLWQTIYNLYKKLWYDVIWDNHWWDWWIIFGKLIFAYKKYWSEEKLKENAINHLLELYIKITNEIEKSEKEKNILEEEIRKEFKKLSKWDKESIKLWKKFTSYSVASAQTQLDRLNVKSDYNIWESFFEWIDLPKIEEIPDLKYNMSDIVKELVDKKIASQNEDNSVWVVFPEDTKIPACMLQKRDWTHGYLASDLSAIRYRIQNWNPEKIIYFTDVRQSLHFKQAFYIADKAEWLKDKTHLIHAPNWFISLKDWAMSTRKWRIIKLDKLLDEAEEKAKKIILKKRSDIDWEELKNLAKIIWIWAIKYWYLKKSRESDSVFDWDEYMSFEGNSWPYVQYAYVRAKKIIKNFLNGEPIEEKIENIKINDFFKETEEIEIVKQLLDYPKALDETMQKTMPHILVDYAYNLTKKFNSFYNNINILNEENRDKKLARLKLIHMFTIVLKDSFDILAIDMPEKM